MATVRQIKEHLEKSLQDIGIELSESNRQAELIVEYLTGWDLAYQVINAEAELPEAKVAKAEHILSERKQRIPLQYCLEQAPFMGMMLDVSRGVLIPRTDTESLVVAVLDKLSTLSRPVVADIGIGSGAIAIALSKARLDISVVGVDISDTAIELAQRNCKNQGVHQQVQIIKGDWKECLPNNLDAIVTNPPYISADDFVQLAPEIRDWEPKEALLGTDTDGLGFYRDLSKFAADHLKSAGFIAMEIPDKAEETITTMFAKADWNELQTVFDVNKLPRAILATTPRSRFSKT